VSVKADTTMILLKLYNAGVFNRIKANPNLLKIVVEHRQIFFRYNAMNYESILTSGVRTLPTADEQIDWRSDYSRTAIMIYNGIPSFDELLLFAEKFEKEFNEWVLKI
jgi:hypothetical protein